MRFMFVLLLLGWTGCVSGTPAPGVSASSSSSPSPSVSVTSSASPSVSPFPSPIGVVVSAVIPGNPDPSPSLLPSVSPGAESADGTTLPPASQIVDDQGNVWTLSSSGDIILDGSYSSGLSGIQRVVYFNQQLNYEGADGTWYVWVSGSWTTP